jgi:anti-sigma regulatory factor (Ser/Thr protein kinase)
MVDSVRLLPEPTSAAAARRFVGARLVGSANCDVAVLLVSELVTNVVLHAQTPLVLRVGRVGNVIRVEVEDQSPTVPTAKPYDRDAVTGRGIHIVERASTRWGVDAGEDGKCVWFELEEPVA